MITQELFPTEGAKRPTLPFKTKEIRWRITADNYKAFAKEGESYEDFYNRREKAVYETIQQENAKDFNEWEIEIFPPELPDSPV